jgi:lipopolysaccharide assembly outer membrane protein LptD (OstA)
MRRLALIGLVAAALAGLACWGFAAETPAPQAPKPAEAKAEEKTHDVYLEHADRLRRNEATGDVVVVGKPVTLKHEDGAFTANEISFNEKTKLGKATGNPSFKDPESSATSDTLEFDFDKRLAVFKGHVTLVATRKKAAPAEKGQEQKAESIGGYAGEPTTITCDRLEYFYREKRAVAAGNVKAVQKRGTAEAESATFLVDQDLLTVAGNVRMTSDKGETFRCDKITISLKENDYWIEAEGQVASHFKVTEKEEAKPAAPAPKAPAK